MQSGSHSTLLHGQSVRYQMKKKSKNEHNLFSSCTNNNFYSISKTDSLLTKKKEEIIQ